MKDCLKVLIQEYVNAVQAERAYQLELRAKEFLDMGYTVEDLAVIYEPGVDPFIGIKQEGRAT